TLWRNCATNASSDDACATHLGHRRACGDGPGVSPGVGEVGAVLGMLGEPLRGPAHGRLVLAVDEPVDGALEPAVGELLEVVALLEVGPGAVGRQRLEPHLAGLVVAGLAADHGVGVAAVGLDVGDQLERRAPAPEWHLVDDPSKAAVAVLVAGPQHLHLD